MIARLLTLPPVLFLLTLAAAAIMQNVVPRALGLRSFVFGMALGSVVWLAAVVIAGAALAHLKKQRTPVEPRQRPTALVTDGIFRLSRNPLYLSLLLVTGGLALMMNALWFLVAAVVLWLLLDRIVVRSEERLLEETFAGEYCAYKHRTRRWL